MPSIDATRPTNLPAWLSTALCAATMLCATAAQAQNANGQGMEQRLRAQLRATTTQLQQAQAELASLKGSTSANDELRSQLDEARAQLASERARAQRLEAAQGASRREVQTVAQASSQYRDDNARLLQNVQSAQGERDRVATELQGRDVALQQCRARNEQLYALGQEVLHAYETVDLGTVLSLRQPFAAKARAKYGARAQDYGDRLYQGRYDAQAPRESSAPE